VILEVGTIKKFDPGNMWICRWNQWRTTHDFSMEGVEAPRAVVVGRGLLCSLPRIVLVFLVENTVF